jgi:hypothetical protein
MVFPLISTIGIILVAVLDNLGVPWYWYCIFASMILIQCVHLSVMHATVLPDMFSMCKVVNFD